jgi:hypothetical protein
MPTGLTDLCMVRFVGNRIRAVGWHPSVRCQNDDSDDSDRECLTLKWGMSVECRGYIGLGFQQRAGREVDSVGQGQIASMRPGCDRRQCVLNRDSWP